jgi:tetratricopeptide (TPR) repeat protein
VTAHLLRGEQKLAAGSAAAALADFQAAENIPDNLPSDRGGARGHEAEIAYYTGLAYEAMGNADRAKESLQQVVSALNERRGRRGFGADGLVSDRSGQRYYQALAQRKLGQTAEADAALKNLLDAANRALEQHAGTADSSGLGGGRQSSGDREALAHYVAGLAHLGLGETDKARQEFRSALQAKPDHLGAKVELVFLESKPSAKSER